MTPKKHPVNTCPVAYGAGLQVSLPQVFLGLRLKGSLWVEGLLGGSWDLVIKVISTPIKVIPITISTVALGALFRLPGDERARVWGLGCRVQG